METPINLQPYLPVQAELARIQKRTRLKPVPSSAVDFIAECDQVAKDEGSDQNHRRTRIGRAKEGTA